MILRELLEVFSVETSIMILDVTTGAPQILARGILHYVELELKANNEQVLFTDVVFVRYERNMLQIEVKKGKFNLKNAGGDNCISPF